MHDIKFALRAHDHKDDNPVGSHDDFSTWRRQDDHDHVPADHYRLHGITTHRRRFRN